MYRALAKFVILPWLGIGHVHFKHYFRPGRGLFIPRFLFIPCFSRMTMITSFLLPLNDTARYGLKGEYPVLPAAAEAQCMYSSTLVFMLLPVFVATPPRDTRSRQLQAHTDNQEYDHPASVFVFSLLELSTS